MLFDKELFKDCLADELADIAAKQANFIIRGLAKCVYGMKYEDGELKGFGSNQKSNNTHVGILINVEEMGTIKPEHKKVAQERPIQARVTDAHTKEIARLTAENNKLRGASNGK